MKVVEEVGWATVVFVMGGEVEWGCSSGSAALAGGVLCKAALERTSSAT